MGRKITKKMLLNLYQDRVELEDELRDRDRDDHLQSCARADDRRDEMIEVIRSLAPQLLAYITQAYAVRSASASVDPPRVIYPSYPHVGVPGPVVMVGGLVKEEDLSKVDERSIGKLAWMLQNLTAAELDSLGRINGLAQARRAGDDHARARNSQPEPPTGYHDKMDQS